MLESLLKLLIGEQTEKIVWTADLTYWTTGQRFNGILKSEYDGEKGHLKLAQDMGLMPYYWYEQFWLADPVYDGVSFAVEKQEDETFSTWNTPIGKLVERTAFVKESLCLSKIRTC